jgi:hypothetical protein
MSAAEKQMLLTLLLEKTRLETVMAPPQTVCGGAGAAPPQTFAAIAARPPMYEPAPPRPLFRNDTRVVVSGNGVVRHVNTDIDYEYLRDWILGGTTPLPGKKKGRGPSYDSPNYSQFAVFRGIYDRDSSLFQHVSDIHSLNTAEPYFSFMYSPGKPHWDIKFHAYGRFAPSHFRTERLKFIVTRVEWYLGNRGETGVVMYNPVKEPDSSDDSASTLTGE